MQTTVLILAAEQPGTELTRALHRRELPLFLEKPVPVRQIIAADGAGDYCLQCGLIPDLLTGDLDSITPAALEKLRNLTTVRQHTDQDRSDLTKGLAEAVSSGAEHVTLLGYRGGRSDHLLGIMTEILANHLPRSISLADDSEVIHHLRPGSYQFHPAAGTLFSLVTFATAGALVTLQGAEYEADRLLLQPGTRGISNRCNGDLLKLTVAQSDLLLIINRRTVDE